VVASEAGAALVTGATGAAIVFGIRAAVEGAVVSLVSVEAVWLLVSARATTATVAGAVPDGQRRRSRNSGANRGFRIGRVDLGLENLNIGFSLSKPSAIV
jgi:hypothetical protein